MEIHDPTHRHSLSYTDEKEFEEESSIGLLRDYASNFSSNFTGSTFGTASTDWQKYVSQGPLARIQDAAEIFRRKFIANNLFFELLYVCVVFMIPSFLKPAEAKSKAGLTPTRANAATNVVQSLDGLRGVASFSVMVLHFSDTFSAEHAFGWGRDESHYWWYQLPFVHAFWAGNSLVSTFFVLSGVVLANKPIQLLREQQTEKLFTWLSSMVFRRGFRLFLPTTIALFIAFLLVRMGAFEPGRDMLRDHREITTASEDPPPLFDGFWPQFRDFAEASASLTNVWTGGGAMPFYDPHLWTIGIEFFGSMVLALVILSVALLKTWARLIVYCTLIYSCVHFDRHDPMLFIVGIMIVESQYIIKDTKEWIEASPLLSPIWNARPEDALARRTLAFIGRVAQSSFFLFGWFLLSTPNADPQETPGFKTLFYLLPNGGLWQRIGACFLVFGVLVSPDAEWLFTRRFPLYLAKISYALYIVHGNVRRVVLYPALPWIWATVGGQETQMRFAAGIFLGMLVMWPLSFVLADMFWRGVDVPSVRIARWIEAHCRAEKKDKKIALS